MKPRPSALYFIHNMRTNTFYIGKSVDPRDRFIHHRGQLVAGKHHNAYLQRSWNQHGSGAFRLLVVGWFETDETALAFEIKLIARLRLRGTALYNLTEGGQCGTSTPEHANRIRESLLAIGYRPGPLALERSRAANTGKKHTPEYCEMKRQQSQVAYAQRLSQGGQPLATGHPKSESWKRAKSEAQKGRVFSPQTLARMSESQQRRREREK